MILIVSDLDYFDKALILIKSIRLQHKDLKIHYHQINFNKKIEINNINYSYENINLDQNKINQYNNIKYSQKQAYCANIRFQIINNLLSENQYILYLDADSIIRKPINQLIDYCKNNDLVINKCTKKKYYRKGFRLRTGVFSIRNTPIMLEFLQNLLNRINLHKWFSDQDSIQDTFIEYVDNIKFKLINLNYIDWYYDDKSEIWVGKGENKFLNQKYLQLENHINTLFTESVVGESKLTSFSN